MLFTIQPGVDKMKEETARNINPSNKVKKYNKKRKAISPVPRPSMVRNTESMSGSCKICGVASWDTDNSRGEIICSECGYVAEQNMIDPGAEWINHSGGEDRSRVGAPTTLTLSDKGLSTGN